MSRTDLSIAVFVDALEPERGGTENQLLMLLTHLLASAQPIMLFTLRQRAELPAMLHEQPLLTHIDLDHASWFSLSSCRRFRQQLRAAFAERPPVFTLGFLRDGNLASWIAGRWLLRCPTIATKRYYEYLNVGDSLTERLKERLLDRIYRCSTVTVVNARSIEQQLRVDSPKACIVTVRNAASLDAAEGADADADSAIAAEAIVCLANLRPIKNLTMLLRALAKLRPEFPELRAVVLGEGPERASLMQEIQRLAIEPMVSLRGYVADPKPFLRRAQMGVLCSDAEGSPNSVLEYMAASLPVVATRVGGIPELVEHGGSGLLVAKDDSDDLADCIARLLRDEHLRQSYGARGRELYHRHHPRTVFAEYQAVFSRVGGQ